MVSWWNLHQAPRWVLLVVALSLFILQSPGIVEGSPTKTISDGDYSHSGEDSDDGEKSKEDLIINDETEEDFKEQPDVESQVEAPPQEKEEDSRDQEQSSASEGPASRELHSQNYPGYYFVGDFLQAPKEFSFHSPPSDHYSPISEMSSWKYDGSVNSPISPDAYNAWGTTSIGYALQPNGDEIHQKPHPHFSSAYNSYEESDFYFIPPESY